MSFLITLLWILAPPAVLAQGKVVRFTGEDGFVLTGTYYPGESDGPGVVLMHQCSGGSRSDFRGLARLLARKGFHALAFDFRGKMPPASFSSTRARGTVPSSSRKTSLCQETWSIGSTRDCERRKTRTRVAAACGT